VEQVVLTSSFSAIVDSLKGLNPSHVYTEEDWNLVTLETVKDNPRLMYTLSKKLAEKAAWDWKDTVHPKFKLASICPPMIYGPVASDTTFQSLNQSRADIWRLMSGEAKKAPPTPMPGLLMLGMSH
jgi:nucleoside-diphosphate-sugar epimerase